MEHGTNGNGTRRLAREYTPVEEGHDSDVLILTLDRDEMSELSDIMIEKLAEEGSPTAHTMMHGVSGKAARSSSFLNRMKKYSGDFLPIYHGSRNWRQNRNSGRGRL